MAANPTNSTLNTSANPLSGGTDAQDGMGNEFLFSVVYSPQLNDQVTVICTDQLTGIQTQIGGGYASGVQPTFCFTFKDRIYALAGSSFYFCALGLPQTWNDPNAAGNGFVTASNWFASPASLQAMAPFQGNLLMVCRDYVQIWIVDPNPADFQAVQILPNIGTMAPLSVQPIGDMDVYMLYDSGVRSIRVRDASNNAIIADIGTPIDMLIQSALAGLSDALKATACGITDPSANRYWLYIPSPADDPASGTTGLIYAFSYFTSSGVAAWSTYLPTFQTFVSALVTHYPASGAVIVIYSGLTPGSQYAWNPGANEVAMTYNGKIFTLGTIITVVAGVTTLTVTGNANNAVYTGVLNLINWFVPQKFEIFKGQVWVRDTNNNIFQYGGPSNAVYENCGVQAITPYIDSGLPGNIKQYSAVESAMQGTWGISCSADYVDNVFRQVYLNNLSTFRYRRIPYSAKGTHYAFQFSEYGTGYARLSNALMHIANPPQGAEK